MATQPNLIVNGNFEGYSAGWKQTAWYPENIVEFYTNGGQSGGYVKLTIRANGDPGTNRIYQSVELKTGATYTLSFYAKRSGNVDLWIQYRIGTNNAISSGSLKGIFLDGYGWKKHSIDIKVPSGSSDTIQTTIDFIAGSAAGYVCYDTIELVLKEHIINPSTPDYLNCYVEKTAYKYSDLDLNSSHVDFLSKGDTVGLYETGNDHFIQCREGGQSYLERQCVNTARSAKTSTRNVANMFGDTTLKYAYPAPEQAKVYNLQWTLNRLGYNCGTVDGKFGEGVDSAVRSFQRKAKLTVDGKVGAGTKSSLIAALDALDS